MCQILTPIAFYFGELFFSRGTPELEANKICSYLPPNGKTKNVVYREVLYVPLEPYFHFVFQLMFVISFHSFTFYSFTFHSFTFQSFTFHSFTFHSHSCAASSLNENKIKDLSRATLLTIVTSPDNALQLFQSFLSNCSCRENDKKAHFFPSGIFHPWLLHHLRKH